MVSGKSEETLQARPPAFQKQAGVGEEMIRLMERLFPICRSITGPGVVATLNLLKEVIPLHIVKIPTGTRVFDWEIPQEWTIRDAYIRNSAGERVVDFQSSNLHVVSYSVPVHKSMTLAELQPHLHSIPENPDWIPYRTSYYSQDWGFCISETTRRSLKEDDTYEVCIDSSLGPGHLCYGELLLPGKSTDEVLISTHICHPSLCNDNLSGIAVATFLASWLKKQPRRYSYRFLFLPGTIGSIAWLSVNEANLKRIKHGLVTVLLGRPGRFTYKRSRRGAAEIDRICEYVLRQSSAEFELRDFVPYGYDERQYCSPGLDLPVGCLSRIPYGEYPEYHTSADNLAIVTPDALAGSLDLIAAIAQLLEENESYVNLFPKGEPQLGRHGLYKHVGGDNESNATQLALLWVLNLSDGKHSLLDIAMRSSLPFQHVARAANALRKAGLLRRTETP